MNNNQKEIDNARNKLNSWQLGQTSKQYESGNNGPGTISSGKGDNGGMSYGTYQIETKKGTMKEYLKYSNNYNHQLDGLVPTTAAFNQKWKQLAASDPEFAKSQHSFIETHHYQPQLNKLENNGYDFSNRGKAIQDMIWSTAVQYGNRTLKVFQRAEQENGLDFNTASNEEIIKAVQKSKLIHVNQDFVSSSHDIRQGVRNRIPREEKSLLELDKYESLISKQKDSSEKQPEKSNHSKDKVEQPIQSNTDKENNKNVLVQKLIDKAKGEIGYIETGNNHTKYADKHIPFAQNKAWCDTFVDSMFIEAYGRPNAQKMLGGIASGTETSKENFQRMRLWHSAKSDYLPQPGDQIFFKNGENEKRTVDHTGIVVKVENGKVYTIEGNTSVNKRDSDGHGVESKVHNLKANNIVGYGTPNWDVLLKQNIQKPATEPEKTPEKQPAATPEKPVQEKHTQEKPEKAADKVEKKEKAELSSQLSPQVQKFSQQCEEKLVECCNKKGITADSPQDFKNISMALTVKGLENGMTKIGQLDIETKGAVVMVFIVSQEEHTKFASVSANDAVKIPVQESIEKIQQMEQQKTQEQQMQQSQTQGMQR